MESWRVKFIETGKAVARLPPGWGHLVESTTEETLLGVKAAGPLAWQRQSLLLKILSGAREMTQRVKTLATNPDDDVNSVPMTHSA